MTVNVDLQTGEFLPDGSLFDGVRYVRLTVDHNPDPRTEKWNGTAIVSKIATETATYDDVALDIRALLKSRQKDILASCALTVRARGVAAWNAMTTQQKIDAAIAEADVWKTLRIFAEKNL